jgi:hypothetical protein
MSLWSSFKSGLKNARKRISSYFSKANKADLIPSSSVAAEEHAAIDALLDSQQSDIKAIAEMKEFRKAAINSAKERADFATSAGAEYVVPELEKPTLDIDKRIKKANTITKKKGKEVEGTFTVKYEEPTIARDEIIEDGSFNIKTGKSSPVVKTVREPVQGPEVEGFDYSNIPKRTQSPQWRTRRYGQNGQISGASQEELNSTLKKKEVLDAADKATAEPIVNSNKNKTGGTGSDPGGEDTNPNHSSWKGTALWVAGGMAGGALLHKALSSNKGQQSNAQLYGQQPLY